MAQQARHCRILTYYDSCGERACRQIALVVKFEDVWCEKLKVLGGFFLLEWKLSPTLHGYCHDLGRHIVPFLFFIQTRQLENKKTKAIDKK